MARDTHGRSRRGIEGHARNGLACLPRRNGASGSRGRGSDRSVRQGNGSAAERSGSATDTATETVNSNLTLELQKPPAETEGAVAVGLHPVVRLLVVPIHHAEANAFVKLHHRHHKPTIGHKFSVAVADDAGTVRGVAIVGRPVSRHLDNGWTLEVNRVCTDGTPNACSKLYQAAWRIAREMGYRKLITYTLPEEGGASLRGAGWKLLGERGGGNWNVKSRPRVDTEQILRGTKSLWEQSNNVISNHTAK